MKADVLPANAANKKITWSSENPEIATVGRNGEVKGVSSGETTVTATAASGAKASYAVAVKRGPATFAITATASCIAKNHVGNNWTKDFFVGDEYYTRSTTFKAEVGQIIEFGCMITENDSYPDTDGFTQKLEMTEDIYKNGYVFSDIVWVEENSGRYSGNCAEWSVKVTIRKKSD